MTFQSLVLRHFAGAQRFIAVEIFLSAEEKESIPHPQSLEVVVGSHVPPHGAATTPKESETAFGAAGPLAYCEQRRQAVDGTIQLAIRPGSALVYMLRTTHMQHIIHICPGYAD